MLRLSRRGCNGEMLPFNNDSMASLPGQFLSELFDTAVRAADPLEALKGRLPEAPKGRTVVIGAG